MTASVHDFYFFFGASFLAAFFGILQAIGTSFGEYCITSRADERNSAAAVLSSSRDG